MNCKYKRGIYKKSKFINSISKLELELKGQKITDVYQELLKLEAESKYDFFKQEKVSQKERTRKK